VPTIYDRVCQQGLLNHQKRLRSALGYLPLARFEAQLTARNMEAPPPQFVARVFRGIFDLSIRCGKNKPGAGLVPLPALIGTDESQPAIPRRGGLHLSTGARFCFTGCAQNPLR